MDSLKVGYCYDDSSFSDVCAVGEDDRILEVMKQRHNIQEFIKPDQFKTYDELKKKLEAVLSGDSFNSNVPLPYSPIKHKLRTTSQLKPC